jgi:hypothetical protein
MPRASTNVGASQESTGAGAVSTGATLGAGAAGAGGVGSSAIETPLDSKSASNNSPASAAPDVRMREL